MSEVKDTLIHSKNQQSEVLYKSKYSNISSQVENKMRKAQQSRKRKEQLKVYLITYVAYAFVHFQREFWSISKPIITKQYPDLTKEVLSRFDTAQLLVYAICLYICGILGDTYNQRIVLTIAYGVLTVFAILLSLAGFFNITSQIYYYFVVCVIGGFNAFMFPCFISIMGNWFPKKSRGFTVSLWATCTNTGNIIGIQLAAALLKLYNDQWQYLMVTVATLFFITGVVIYFYLIPEPEMIGIMVEEYTEEKEALIDVAQDKQIFEEIKSSRVQGHELEEKLKQSHLYQALSMTTIKKEGHLSFWKAWFLPRVLLYSIAFFCTKLAVYCLLLWLPLFTEEDLGYTHQDTANLSTMVDVGAILGSMSLGYVSDLMYGKRSPVALLAVIFATVVSFVLTFEYHSIPKGLFFVLMFFLGFFISGLNNMINAACAADLGKQEALKGNQKAVSTVTGIIDGTGTLGTAAGQLIVGITEDKYGWQKGYLLVISIDIALTLLPILKIVYEEFKQIKNIKYSIAKLQLNQNYKEIEEGEIAIQIKTPLQ